VRFPPEGKAACNERRKALAATINVVGTAVLIAAFIQPLASGDAPSVRPAVAATAFFFVCQGIVHYILGLIED
jgi:hypothetical protein